MVVPLKKDFNEYYDFEVLEKEEVRTFSSILDSDDILQMYLKDIGRTKMLKREEELELGRKIREGTRFEKYQAKQMLIKSMRLSHLVVYTTRAKVKLFWFM